jgi:hypothetical protein
MDNTHLTGGLDFTKGDDRLFVEGKCDETISKFCKDVGWYADF